MLKFTKMLAGFAAVGLVLAVVVSPAPASAQTVAELQALIAQLQAQIAALAGGASTATSATFTRDLTVGSTGADVLALQKLLNSKGFTIATTGAGAPGSESTYFGAKTKAALAAFQAANGITPASGYFGPKTRAAVAGVVVTPGTTPGTVVNDGTDGSVTASLSSYVGSGTQIKKGETKDMIALKFQATAGAVSVNRFDVRFNARPWLYFSKIVLKDTNGNLIAEKSISGSADATEITAGSDYMVRFDNVNYTVKPGDDRILVVSGAVLSATDKLSSNVSVTVSVPANSIRTTNGKGYTDSLGDSTFTRTVTLLAAGSTGNIVTRISPSTPATRVVNTSTNGQTDNVILGVFDFKSENNSSKIEKLRFNINNSAGNSTTTVATIFKTLQIVDGSTVYNVDTVGTDAIFSSLSIDLAQDQWKSITLRGNVADADDFTNGTVASSSLAATAGSISGIDSNFNSITATANTVISNNTTFLSSGAALSNLSSVSTPVDNGTSAVSTSSVKFMFTFANTSNSDLYLSKTASTMLATSTTAVLGNASTITTSPTTLAGDAATYYVVPSGTSRAFTIEGDYGNDGGTSGTKEFKITKVYFDDDTTGLQEFNIDFGLENLRTSSYLNN